jgi:predicted hotdog family 3-hydroxylacyl-ACP dehydratase
LIAIATNHTEPNHPLRSHGRLGTTIGIEYAAQAMAVHSALIATEKSDIANVKRPQAGFLASVRSATCHVPRLDDLTEALQIEVVCIHGESNGILYQFTVRGNDTQKPLLDGRAAVIIDAYAIVSHLGEKA